MVWAATGGPAASPADAVALGPENIALETGPVLAPASTAASGPTSDDISCQGNEQVVYHIHAHLQVYVDGAARAIPAGIGTVEPLTQPSPNGDFTQASRCYYWLHTHASDGVIHIESPTQLDYTLGEFFDIWRQPLDTSHVGPASGPVTAYLNGNRWPGNPRDIPLGPRADIQLDVGGSPAPPPQPVDWSKSGL